MRIFIFLAAIAVLLTGPAQSKPVGQSEACAVQEALKIKGFYDGDIDCDLGPGTARAVKEFQRSQGLYPDGVAGEDTFYRLMGYRRGERERQGREEEGQEGEERGEANQCGDIVVEATVERLGAQRATTGAWKAWASKVATTEGLGLRYADPGLAQDKTVECIKASATAMYTKNCTVRARPCRSGVAD